MKIIIVGCGKVGVTLAEKLNRENHDIILVDRNSDILRTVTDSIDVMSVTGNGAIFQTQIEAGIQEADLLIATTNSDELNMLCCLIAKKAGKCSTIARVRNPVYSKEINFIKERLGVSMTINPELTAATEIARLLRFPSAIKIDTFAKGRVELLKFKIRPQFKLDQLAVSALQNTLKSNILVAAVEREDNVYIPNGDFILKDGDLVSIIASPQNAANFFQTIGLKTNQVRNCMIVGGGTIAFYLAKELLSMKIPVRIVEKDPARCELLSQELPHATIICGDGTDRKILLEEGLCTAEGFVSLTNMDEENLMLALFAKDQSSAKLVTKVNRLAFDEIIERLDIGSVVYPKYLTADYILQYVRAMQNTIGSNVETLYQILDDRAEALEFAIHEESPVTDTPLMELNLKDNLLIGCIHRRERVFIPRGHDSIQVGDTVIIVTTQVGLQDIRDILK